MSDFFPLGFYQRFVQVAQVRNGAPCLGAFIDVDLRHEDSVFIPAGFAENLSVRRYDAGMAAQEYGVVITQLLSAKGTRAPLVSQSPYSGP